jgi:cell shape-determining protein MreC
MIAPAHARRLLPVTFVVLGVLALFVPVRYLAWMSGFGHLAQVVVSPVSGPVHQLMAWLAPAGGARQSEEVQQLRREAEEYHVQLLQALAENDQLRDQIKELQRGHALDPDLAIQQITVPVIGTASDIAQEQLTIRAGSRQGVDLNTVATTSGLQLVGRVVAVGSLTSTVAPITSKAAGAVQGMVMIDDTANGLSCTLAAGANGTLTGDVEDRRNPATGAPIEPQVGQIVRLSDPALWPRSAQMLLIGKVEKVEPSPKQPLRKVITVRPTVDNLERVSQVVLRIIPAADEPRTAPKRGGP